MRGTVRSIALTIAALMGAVLLTVTSAFISAVAWGALALIVPGTGTPDPSVPANYQANAIAYYINPNFVVPADPSACPAGDCDPVPVPYIAQFWPFPFPGWGGLQGAKWNVSVASGVAELNQQYGIYHDGTQNIVIFGYSQGANVASTVKGQLALANGGLIDPDTTFVFIGNPNRPNGGLFERGAALGTVPILDATFGNPTPTNTAEPGVINTTDIAFQYDGVADFPAYPLNFLADLNAIAGFAYVHGTYLAPDGDEPPTETPFGYTPAELQAAMNDPANQQIHGDTLYITIPAKSLPIMVPFLQLGTATGTSALVNPVVALLQPATQTLIETGYDRTDYGTPTPFRIIPRVNPIKLGAALIADVPEGISAAAATIQSPTHTIPDLPPSWGPSASTLVASDESNVTTFAEREVPARLADDPAVPAPPATTTSHRTLTPVNLIARPNVLLATGKPALTSPFGTSLTNPSGTNVHPMRDVATAAAGAISRAVDGVKKALGKDDAA
jgi:hypothetical protein